MASREAIEQVEDLIRADSDDEAVNEEVEGHGKQPDVPTQINTQHGISSQEMLLANSRNLFEFGQTRGTQEYQDHNMHHTQFSQPYGPKLYLVIPSISYKRRITRLI